MRAVADGGDKIVIVAIEKRLRRLPGVKSAVMNPASESASVSYDETATTIDAIRSAVEASCLPFRSAIAW